MDPMTAPALPPGSGFVVPRNQPPSAPRTANWAVSTPGGTVQYCKAAPDGKNVTDPVVVAPATAAPPTHRPVPIMAPPAMMPATRVARRRALEWLVDCLVALISVPRWSRVMTMTIGLSRPSGIGPRLRSTPEMRTQRDSDAVRMLINGTNGRAAPDVAIRQNRAMAEALVCPDLVGRDDELRTLDAAMARAIEGQATVALVSGEAGVGKTRLIGEAARRAAGAGARVLTGRCVPLGGDGLPLAPLADALRELASTMTPE